MKNKPMTYRQLDRILLQLGFERAFVERKWLRYEHVDSDTIIIVVEKKPNELVRVTDALSARIHLVQKGFVTEEELDAMLGRKAPAKNR